MASKGKLKTETKAGGKVGQDAVDGGYGIFDVRPPPEMVLYKARSSSEKKRSSSEKERSSSEKERSSSEKNGSSLEKEKTSEKEKVVYASMFRTEN